MEFKATYNNYLETFNHHIQHYFTNDSNAHAAYLNQAMRYSLLSGGKRIRPILSIAFYDAFGGTTKDILPLAAAIEMIHTYSLIHDDLPVMDDDDYRRGQKASHVKFDDATAILTGDSLLNAAYEVLFDYLDQNFNKNTLKACQLISHCAGGQGMIIGQIADMNLSEVEMSLDNLEFINHNKTGKLLKASIVSPGLLLGLDNKKIEQLSQLSIKVGLAFQLKDDLLEIEGDEKTLGKPINSDIKNKKTTYINMIGLKATKDQLDQLQQEARNILKQLSINHQFINALIDYIFTRKS